MNSYEYQILSQQIALLQRQMQCLKNQIDACCSVIPPPPTCNELQITSQPQSASVSVGDTVHLTVVVTGDAPITYQWKKNGVIIGGAIAATYSLPDITSDDEGTYTVTLTNPCGSITSTPAQVLVSVPVQNFTAYWGWADAPITTIDQVQDLQGVGQFPLGATIVADFTANSLPEYLILAEPVTEPLKTKWYGTDLNKGNIGTDDDLFSAPVIIGEYRVYTTAYPTQQQDTVIQFKVN